MAEEISYEFNAPRYADLLRPDDDDDDLDSFFATPLAAPEQRINPKSPKAVTPKPPKDVAPKTPRLDKIKETPSKPSPTLVSSLRINLNTKTGLPQEFPVRQSPRLAAIAKEIRRRNSNRSLNNNDKNHRRSLSDSAVISKKLTKVRKSSAKRNSPQVSKGESLSDDDLATLGELTNLKKTKSTSNQQFEPTVPKAFSFATDLRLRDKGGAQPKEGGDATSFVRTLRSHINASKAIPKGPTKVRPFNLHEPPPSKANGAAAQLPFVSIAELNMKFHTQTPLRFRTQKRNAPDGGAAAPKRGKNANLGPTVPHTPQLSCGTRSRPVKHPTREEEEEQQIQEAQRHAFKANPVDKRIYEHSPVRIPEKKKSIAPTKETAAAHKFDAAHVSSFLKGVVPHEGVPVLWSKKTTEVQPFSFDERDSRALKVKKQHIQKMIDDEKKLAEFHAHPMPAYDERSDGLPPKKPPTPTRLQPFDLQTDARGASKQKVIRKELEDEDACDRERRTFHAQSDAVLHREPFIPKKAQKALTDISGFSLNTEKRSKERYSFDLKVKQKEDEIQAQKRQHEELKRQEEDKMVSQMRRDAVHKAQPIKKFTPVRFQPGLNPPTIPISPDLRTKTRSGLQKAVSEPIIDQTLIG